MFAPDVARWLQSHSTPRLRKFLEDSRSETAAQLREAGIPADSEVAHFYLQYGASTCRGGYGLIEPDEIAEATQYVRDELAVPVGFVALTGFEGEGVVLYALENGAVYDVELRTLDAFLAGTLAPIAATFEGFLRWCMSR